jgi:ribonuclease HI
MKQLGEDMIRNIPKTSAIIYTDGSTLKNGKSGSAAHIVLPNKIINISTRNSDGSSNYTAEVKAIENGLQAFIQENVRVPRVYIISDSKSAIQAVCGCFTSLDDSLQRISKLIESTTSEVEI